MSKNFVSETISNLHTSKRKKDETKQLAKIKKKSIRKITFTDFIVIFVSVLMVFNLEFHRILLLVCLDYITFSNLDFDGLFTDRKIIERF